MLRRETVGDRLVRESGDEGLSLRRPRHDRRARDREELPLELDVVHPLAVEELPRLEVADDRVVLPRVGQTPDDVGDLPRLAEGGEKRGVVFDATGCRQPGRSVGAAPEVPALLRGRARDESDTRAAAAHVIERLQARRQVERLGVGRRRGGDETDPACGRGEERRQQHRIETPAGAIAAGLGIRLERSSAQAQRVFDRREDESRSVGRAGQGAPVGGRGQLGGPGRGLAPRGRVPAGPVQGDGEVDAVGHRGSFGQASAAHCRPDRDTAQCVT